MITRYLRDFGDEVLEFYPLIPKDFRWDHLVLIPLTHEYELLEDLLLSIKEAALAAKGRVLLMVLINGREDCSLEGNSDHEKSMDRLAHGLLRKVPLGGFGFVGSRGEFDILCLEYTIRTRPFQAKEGVGHARKKLADLALKLKEGGQFSGEYFHVTDGDALVPRDYFLAPKDQECVAMTFPFLHVKDGFRGDELYWQALCAYDLWLRYYQLGLKSASSPYALDTIGSLLLVHCEAYALVRGFPRRLAGEDFYLLNKLRKLGPIRSLKAEPLRLRCRSSDRVPFGTGPGTAKFYHELKERGAAYVMHPQCFEILKIVLQSVQSQDFKGMEASLEREGDEVVAICREQRFEWAYQEARKRARDELGALREFHSYFDGFKTMKFLHRLRDEVYSTVPLTEAFWTASFVELSSAKRGLLYEELLQELLQMRGESEGRG